MCMKWPRVTPALTVRQLSHRLAAFAWMTALLLVSVGATSSGDQQRPSIVRQTADVSVLEGTGAAAPKLSSGAELRRGPDGAVTLVLAGHAYAEAPVPDSLSGKEGTLSLWIKPLWPIGDRSSHTIITMTWADPDRSYMALSQGWWEPAGQGRLYFILSNQDYVHCSTDHTLETQVWSRVAATWRTGKGGFCRLFIDDEQVAAAPVERGLQREPGPRLVIGSDVGAGENGQRPVESELKLLSISPTATSGERVYGSYHAERRRDPGLAPPPRAEERARVFPTAEATFTRNSPQKYAADASGLTTAAARSQGTEASPAESRVIFDEGIDWALSRAATDRRLERIREAGFNVYVPSVWHGRGTYYPSEVARPDPRLKARIASGDDPLAYLLERAHHLGIEVHAWFTVVLREDEQYPHLFSPGVPDRAYDVHNGAFRDFAVTLVEDLVSRYAVDGVNLDYIRAMGICSSQECAEAYRKQTGRTLSVDIIASHVNSEARRSIRVWQDGAVADIVKRVHQRIRAIRPQILISVDANAYPENDGRRPLQGQNVVGWANTGWIDMIFHMDYARRPNLDRIRSVSQSLDEPERLAALFGNYANVGNRVVPRKAEDVVSYVHTARQTLPGNPFALYLYSMLTDAQLSALSRSVFKAPAKTQWPSRNTEAAR